MGQDWLTQGGSQWAVAVIAFLLGLLAAWAARRMTDPKPDAPGGDLGSEPEERVPGAALESDAAASAKLSALEAEIRKARSILNADAEERAEMAEILAGIDEAVKRANGRLKLILKSLKNDRNDD